MLNIGTHRGERRKWIHCFENITALAFCVALSEYDQVLNPEHSNQTRIMESIAMFGSIFSSRWFTRSTIILFLNKLDLFKMKLSQSPLADHFPDYLGGNDVNRAAAYLIGRFNQVKPAHLNSYSQYCMGIIPILIQARTNTG